MQPLRTDSSRAREHEQLGGIEEAIRRSPLAEKPAPPPVPEARQRQLDQEAALIAQMQQATTVTIESIRVRGPTGVSAAAAEWLNAPCVRRSLEHDLGVQILPSLPQAAGSFPRIHPGGGVDLLGPTAVVCQPAERRLAELVASAEERAAWEARKRNRLIHVFFDDSNVIHGAPGAVEAAEAAVGGGGAGVHRHDVHVDTAALIAVVEDGRWCAEDSPNRTEAQMAAAAAEGGGGCCRYAVGSGDPNAPRWPAYRAAGYHTTVHPRRHGEREHGVDAELQALIASAAAKRFGGGDGGQCCRTLVIVTGDGNDNHGKVKFPSIATDGECRPLLRNCLELF